MLTSVLLPSQFARPASLQYQWFEVIFATALLRSVDKCIGRLHLLKGRQAFGLVCSASSNAVYDGKQAYVPALEDVLVWDVKKGEMVRLGRCCNRCFSCAPALHVARNRAQSRSDLHCPLTSTRHLRCWVCRRFR